MFDQKDPGFFLEQKWFVVKDDEVGGYAIANADKPTSHLDRFEHERTLAHFVWKEHAEYMVNLHNWFKKL